MNVLAQIAEIQALDLARLRERWQVLYGKPAPRYSREHLIRRLAYRIQELAHGGLSDATRSQLRAIAEKGGANGQVRPLARRNADSGAPVPGTRIIRTWRDRRLEVVVLNDGFEFEGRSYRSLSAIAREVTSARWNGWLFFGLRSRRKEPS